ncbi:MAG TPA: zf-HC2 domain-containing protein [Polyangium sp.]|jgi:anti-sigma factor RsiW|nr:zf-HC2 domain-containing protein [Polyangium sp.]
MSLVVPTHPTCREIVELVTSYLEGVLTAEERDRFELHLGTCGACVAYHEQMLMTRQTISALQPEPVAPETEANLLAGFRRWKNEEQR